MPEGFQVKTMGTVGVVQSVQEEIKKKKKKRNDSKVINHVLLCHENHSNQANLRSVGTV